MRRAGTWTSLVVCVACLGGCGGEGRVNSPDPYSGSVTSVEEATDAQGHGEDENPPILFASERDPSEVFAEKEGALRERFDRDIKPLLVKYCEGCHGAKKIESGIRVDRLDGSLEDRWIPLMKGIRRNLAEETMPPEDAPKPTETERELVDTWVSDAVATARTRIRDKNGTVRRLTVAQYRHTIRDLLGLEDDLAAVLPADSVSADGFLNNSQAMVLSPLLIEAYFEIAEKALDRVIVDPSRKPVIQCFQVELGHEINKKPFKDKLILGALSRLLRNRDFIVSQPRPDKPFAYDPFVMQTKFRFIEGYQGNDTVRGWREYDSIYHNVFACVRGTDGYPKGLAYQPGRQGLLLRPAIPSPELFGVSSTYGPQANFKISLRELPDLGRFRVTVTAARIEDGLLLDAGTTAQPKDGEQAVMLPVPSNNLDQPSSVSIPHEGIYQVDTYLGAAASAKAVATDDSRLNEQLIGVWPMNGDARRLPIETTAKNLAARLEGRPTFVKSPFGKAVSLNGTTGHVVVPRDGSMKVGDGEFTVAAWIRPDALRQSGIVCLGGYGYQQGFVFDMPSRKGVLRLETAKSGNEHNGTVQSRPGVIRKGVWQHVAVICRREDKLTRLYVNGFEVGAGKIGKWDLDNPKVELHIGRVQGAHFFKGDIDEVRFYRRALAVPELQALIEPGRRFAQAPPDGKPKALGLTLGDRHFEGMRSQPAFLAVRLPKGPLRVVARQGDGSGVGQLVLTRLDKQSSLGQRFTSFERQRPRLGVHVGLRRDCGSTLSPVGPPQVVEDTSLKEYLFEGAISNFPSPDVEKDNVNYLAGIREIGVRSEYTDGRDMPRLAIRSVRFEGPFYESWPPRSHEAIFIESEHKPPSREYAMEVIVAFANRAFRRPATALEAAGLVDVWSQSFEKSGDFTASIKDALLVVLTSPQFLFLIENSESPKPEALEDYELASKLSYFLWNRPPDEQLLELASAGTLSDRLDEQATRLIQDRRSWAFCREFTSQWLSLDKLDVLEVDRKRFGRLTRDTKVELREEPARFLEHLLANDLSLRNLVASDFVVANEVVATYYGLGDRTDAGFRFEAIRHESDHLGGLLSQAGILAALSDGRESNPVKRGAWLARKIIAEPPEPPPPNVPDLEEKEGEKFTMRQKLERHRNQKGCAKCHAGIDPWGLPFEQFDAGGLFRKDMEIDPSSTLPDETEIADHKSLKVYLAGPQMDKVAFSFLKHLAIYATGRSMTYNELEWLREQASELKKADYRIREAFRVVLLSPMFLEK